MSSAGSSDNEETEPSWNLGFLEKPLDTYSLLRHKFRSKVGGRPAWLNPKQLPSEQEVRCKATGCPLNFLLQVYSPVEGNDAAFHRMVYLFITAEGDKLTTPGAVRAFRCQLPLENEFYSARPSTESLPPPVPVSMLVTGKSPAWRKEMSTSPQQDPWHVLAAERCLAEQQPLPTPDDRVLYPEWNLLTDAEIMPTAAMPTDRAERLSSADSGGAILDSDVTEDVEADISAVTSKEQKHFAEFAARVSWDPDQVLRYCFEEGAEPLWPSPSPVPSVADIPPCEYCSGPRRFEFEVLPQLLNYLGGNDEEKDALDWGAIAVYSCTASCSAARAYCEEFVWVQP